MKKFFLLLSILLIPNIVFASSGNDFLPIGLALGMETFVSIHMSIFVLIPLSKLLSQENSMKTFWKLFFIRLIILLFFDFFVTTSIAIFDFIAVFVGAFGVVPVLAIVKKKNPINQINKVSSDNLSLNEEQLNNQISNNQSIVLKCAKCGSSLKVFDENCPVCGEPFEGNNVIVSTEQRVLANPSDFDPIFNNSEEELLELFLKKELEKAGVDSNNTLIPSDALKRKKILNVIFSILLFIYISLIFFHFPIYTYVIGIIILFIFFIMTRRYNLIKYLKKEVKSRPSEKISNIVMAVKNSFVIDDSKTLGLITIIIALILPLMIFMNPRIMYEKVDNGYAVRFYTFGLTNFKTVNIPETYKGKNVVSLRGNTFSNMPFLEKVTLPNTVIEIRGQVFKNDINLVKVNIPTNLEYLGGGSFYNCKSIINIELPDTLTYMGGETFYNAKSLKTIKLSQNLSEIRGNTFENCSSLEKIEIPDNITRIGGHAFYGNSLLSKVTLTENSKLSEIGSSAFRLCHNLSEITIPANTDVNYRAFKESPTTVKRFGEDNEINY